MAENAFIAVGSNIDPIRYLPAGVQRLAQLGRIRAVSRVYQNPAVGSALQADYLNAAVLLETELAPLALRSCLREIEAGLGRVRSDDRYSPRTIDLDLCLYGSLVMNGPELTLPSPDIWQRAYLAVTLAELAPDQACPLRGEPLGVIAQRLRSSSRLIPRLDVVLGIPPA